MPTRRSLLWGASLIALATTALLAGCARLRQTPPAATVVRVPDAVHSEWIPAAPQAQGFDPAALAQVFDDGAKVPALRALLVVRNGLLLGERYYGGATADDLQPLNSVTKSVTSLLAGQALARGTINGFGATVAALLPEDVARVPGSPAAKVTLAQILSGHTGLQYDWLAQYDELESTPDLIRMALKLPAAPDPAAWSYNDPAIALVSPMLARAEGQDLARLAERDLFAPLGIERYSWRRDRSGRTSSHVGLALRPRDLMKIVWTMADAGAWRGRPVVPREWVADSTRSQGPASWRVAPVSDIGYGYLWFTGRIDGQPVIWGWGYGGQFALWAPALRLAVITAAESPPPEQVGVQTQAIMALVARVVRAAR